MRHFSSSFYVCTVITYVSALLERILKAFMYIFNTVKNYALATVKNYLLAPVNNSHF